MLAVAEARSQGHPHHDSPHAANSRGHLIAAKRDHPMLAVRYTAPCTVIWKSVSTAGSWQRDAGLAQFGGVGFVQGGRCRSPPLEDRGGGSGAHELQGGGGTTSHPHIPGQISVA